MDWHQGLQAHAAFSLFCPPNVMKEPPATRDLANLSAWLRRGTRLTPAEITVFVAGAAYMANPREFIDELRSGADYGLAARNVLRRRTN